MQFLTFDDAVEISKQIEAFFNSTDSDEIILDLQKRFPNLSVKENFFVHVQNIEKNCGECMGCKEDSCILGCFFDEVNFNKVCFWDQALEKIIGTRLIIHEYGHVIYAQIFANDLGPEQEFEQSEEFAQFFEDNFSVSVEFCENCSEKPLEKHLKVSNFHMGEIVDQFVFSIIGGLGFGIGSIVLAWVIQKLASKQSQEIEVV